MLSKFSIQMAGLYEDQAEMYAKVRPTYPDKWFSKLASLTARHMVAWDAGTGNGQAALKVSKYYDRVIATDISKAQITHAFPHPKVHYIHTPPSTTEDDLVAMLGGEGSIDLVTVATAIHWFDLSTFYSVVNRILRKPGGILAVWGYGYNVTFTLPKNNIDGLDSLQDIMQRYSAAVLPYFDPRALHFFEGYKRLPFPFESIGMGSEGCPLNVDMEFECTLDQYVAWLRTSSAAAIAKARGIELVRDEVVSELHSAWGGGEFCERKKVTLKAFMLVGKPK